MLQSNEIRERFLKFFEKRGHTIIPSASLIPENDPSVLFNTAGMQPLVPYLLGATHPTGATRLADSQKCVRTGDIDETGDNTHLTFFEMLGNWSLGDYFKEEAIQWSFEFLTSKEEGLGLDPKRLYVTVFEGDDPSTPVSLRTGAPKDMEAFEIWKKYMPENRLYFMSAKSNWWSPGDNGPCGPDSEMFYDVTEKGLGDMTKEEYMAADDRQDVVEIWNDVFMEYEKKDGKVIGKLSQKNVDTGSGLERVTTMVQGKKNIYETDLFAPILEKINSLATTEDIRTKRIFADHIRASVFLIADGVVPSNTDQGYVLRRLLRRAVRYSDKLGIPENSLGQIVDVIVEKFKGAYSNLSEKHDYIKKEIMGEEEKFRKTLEKGIKEFEKLATQNISGQDAFMLFSSYGFPVEMTEELAKEKGLTVDLVAFNEEMKKHQELSRSGSEQKFKGGLGDTSEISIRYHKATHLLHKALREVLGDTVFQKGSNITPERMRFDFSYGEKMTDEQKKKVEDLVNEKIKEALPVSYEDLPIEEARKRGAMGLFGDKYGDTVRMYSIGEGDGSTSLTTGSSTGLTAGKWSVEICGGPHVKNTSELGHFKIVKEEACSAGVRRIKAVLE